MNYLAARHAAAAKDGANPSVIGLMGFIVVLIPVVPIAFVVLVLMNRYRSRLMELQQSDQAGREE